MRTAAYVSVALIAALYAFGAWAMSVATGPEEIVAASRQQSSDLIFNLADAHLGTAISDVGRVLFVTSVLAAMISFHNTTARYMFALGRERVLPAALGRTSMRTGSPMVGSTIQSAIGLVVIVLYAAFGLDPMQHLFYWCGTSGGLGVLLLIAVTSIAIISFFARNDTGESRWRGTIAPVLAAIAVIGVVVLVLANFATLIGVPENSPLRWGIPLVYLGVGGVGALWGLVLRSRHPRVYATIGLGAKSATTHSVLARTLSTPDGDAAAEEVS